MVTHRSQASLHTDPRQVWEELETEHQRRALQLLAQMALNFLTAHAPPRAEGGLGMFELRHHAKL